MRCLSNVSHISKYCFKLSGLFFNEQTKDVNAISLRIEESLKSKTIFKKKEKSKANQECTIYKPREFKKMGYYDILTEISENVTLVQFMYSLGNTNNDISVVM